MTTQAPYQATPLDLHDPVNAAILAVSEDRIQGFHRDPLGEIARLSGISVDLVIMRIAALLQAGVIRRVRQTLLATNLASGALVAWEIPLDRLSAGFDYLYDQDPFSGHVVIRSTDGETTGSKYRLWTTVKVPQGFSLEKHCAFLMRKIGTLSFKIMPAKRVFVLGVGHVRRKGMEPGSKAEALAEALETRTVELSDRQWRVLTTLKREFSADELCRNLWDRRAMEAGVSLEEFFAVGEQLLALGVIGRFSTFLEHVKPLPTGEKVTQYNALFHWAVPVGREIDAGRQVGRFHIMTHAYWRDGGPELGNVNIMGVAHGKDKNLLLAHKAAIDAHLTQVGIPILYTNVFWGGRSEIKPSEIVPQAYSDWCREQAIDPDSMRR
ncbi:MAG: Lrp/AsnC family transcriptional regulator [Phycisphaerae bacterium]